VRSLTPISATDAGVRLRLRIQPRASREEVAGVAGGAIRIRLTAPPVDGTANDALIRFLAARLKVPRSAVELASGRTGRTKRPREQHHWKPSIRVPGPAVAHENHQGAQHDAAGETGRQEHPRLWKRVENDPEQHQQRNSPPVAKRPKPDLPPKERLKPGHRRLLSFVAGNCYRDFTSLGGTMG
jgi:uncharacterized protein (TIGR00251 family)